MCIKSSPQREGSDYRDIPMVATLELSELRGIDRRGVMGE